jgi:hypothetical protein
MSGVSNPRKMLTASINNKPALNTFAAGFRRPLVEFLCAFTISFSYRGLRAHVRQAECRRKADVVADGATST